MKKSESQRVSFAILPKLYIYKKKLPCECENYQTKF